MVLRLLFLFLKSYLSSFIRWASCLSVCRGKLTGAVGSALHVLLLSLYYPLPPCGYSSG